MKKRAMHWIRRAGIRWQGLPGHHGTCARGGRADYSDKGGNAHYYEAAFYAEPESITDTFVFSCAVVEGADGLEALSDAQCYTEEEVYDPGDNAHGCDSGITVRACKAV